MQAVAIAPDGTWLAAACGRAVVIWDATGKQRHALTGLDEPVSAIAIAPHGSWLAVSQGDTVSIWDTTAFRLRHRLTGHPGLVNALTIASSSTWLVASGSRMVQVWDAKTGRQRYQIGRQDAWRGPHRARCKLAGEQPERDGVHLGLCDRPAAPPAH